VYYTSEDNLTNTERKHLQRALAVASTSTCSQRHGVVIAHGPRVLAVGINRNRNSPHVCTNPKRDAAVHAEVAAMKQLRDIDWSKVTLYSARMLKTNVPGLARPCPRCAAVIEFAGVGKIIHT
jgi:tRNA(Arg) A34 adenosine deaminase TadA